VAQVELKTRPHDKELGTHILIEGSAVQKQEACSSAVGTTFIIKNLFYNIPARRNFLKSDTVELKHIMDELERVSLAHPDIAFSLHHNDNELLQLRSGNLKQRIVGIYGTNYNERLVPVEEETTIINMHGYIGKPEFAKRTRGEQFFFVNQRFIKDNYLNHAVTKAFDELLPEGCFPSYFLFIDIDPAKIDINIHPTKTEIKFEDEKSIYAIIRSAVKRALGKYSIAPSIDFDAETIVPFPVTMRKGPPPPAPTITVDTNYNPFKTQNTGNRAPQQQQSFKNRDWKQLYDGLEKQQPEPIGEDISKPNLMESPVEKRPVQLHGTYILSTIRSGMVIIDQQAAHERILLEKLLYSMESKQASIQKLLFPQTIELSHSDFHIIQELEDDLKIIGFEIAEFGKSTVAVSGTPADLQDIDVKAVFEYLIEQFKLFSNDFKLDKRTQLAKTLARKTAIRTGKTLSEAEMNNIINELFACQAPQIGVSGKPTYWILTLEELSRKFQ
jgi:DNA mismatch repair protein MutL